MESSGAAAALPARERIAWLDAARALAILSVCCNHALFLAYPLSSGMRDFSLKAPLLSAGIALLQVFSRLGVPLFLMISGALLLDRDYSRPGALRRFYVHNWLSLLVAAELWNVLIYLVFPLIHGFFGPRPALSSMLKDLGKALLFLNADTVSVRWYMAMILCLYPLIPLLAAAIRRLPGKALLVPGLTLLLFAFLVPNLNAVLEAAGASFRLESAVEAAYLLPVYVLYLVLGRYLSRGLPGRRPAWALALGFCLSLLGTALFQFWVFRSGSDYGVRYADLGVLLSGAFLFALLRRSADCRLWRSAAIRTTARCAFGIYFLHFPLMSYLVELRFKPALSRTPTRHFLILWALAFFGSLPIVWLTAKLPPLGKYLYLIRPEKKNG